MRKWDKTNLQLFTIQADHKLSTRHVTTILHIQHYEIATLGIQKHNGNNNNMYPPLTRANVSISCPLTQIGLKAHLFNYKSVETTPNLDTTLNPN